MFTSCARDGEGKVSVYGVLGGPVVQLEAAHTCGQCKRASKFRSCITIDTWFFSRITFFDSVFIAYQLSLS